jgi:hypothetical protein
MRTWALAGVIAVFVLTLGVVHAQNIADHVVINELDINPPGNDAKSISEWVELYNPTGDDVDIGGWKIASTTVTKKTFTIPAGTQIKAGQFLVYSYTHLWFPDVSEKVQLRDVSGNIIDETPIITDKQNDFSSWQRKLDGLDRDKQSDWEFRTSTTGTANVKIQSTSAEGKDLEVFVTTDKKSYVFGESLTITGNVTKQVFVEKPTFSQQPITINIDGPGNADLTKTLYPDLNLEFKLQLKLDKVLGYGAGKYTVFVEYGKASNTASFSLGEKKTDLQKEIISELAITTDKASYIPGQRVKISATTSNIVPLQGLSYGVYDPNGARIFSGKLFPTTKGEFSGQIELTTVKPIYGIYDIIADYDVQHAEVSFEVVEDIRDKDKIVLNTDKKVYELGEPIIISGRSNKYVASLDLEVLQTGVTAIGKKTNNVLKVTDQVTLAGDSTFEYKLEIPVDTLRLGDYRVTISKEFGKSITYFTIAESPDEYSELQDEFVSTDKPIYTVNEKLIITGHVPPKSRSSFEAVPVYITIKDENGNPLTIVAQDKKLRIRDPSYVATYSFTAIPDIAGSYKLETQLNRATFKPGSYTVEANYEKNISMTTFSVTDDLDLGTTVINAKTDKSVYGLGETVKLEGTLFSGQPAVKIVLTKPDGKTTNSGAKVDNGKFSWSWQIPQKEYALADIRDPRESRPTVFGNYKITMRATSENADVFFKVSENPETDTLVVKPLEVRTEKQIYSAGEKLVVLGSATKRQASLSTGGQFPDRVTIVVRTMDNKQIFDGLIPFDNAGQFKTTFELPLTIFKEGKYKVTAIYYKLRAETIFEIKNEIPLGAEGNILVTLSTDKEEYSPGEVARITGTTNRVIFLSPLDLIVIHQDDENLNCGAFYCGVGGKIVDISRSYNNGFYSYDYKIPLNAKLGDYTVKVDTDFGTFTKAFKVVEKKTPKEPSTTKISEKFNRITDSIIDVSLYEQNLQGQQVAPWAVQGSVVTSKGSEKLVNLKITADDGSCIIGQDEDCLVSKTTKSAQTDYSLVTFAGQSYKVTYSGPDVLLEKFSIMPESEASTIPDSIWTVEIIKENESSKFYYEIIYKPIQ